MSRFDQGTAKAQMDHAAFLRRVHCLRGHLEAVVRMVDEMRDCGEVLRQVRAVRRAAEKLELQCLLSHLASEDEGIQPRAIQKVVELYRLANR